LTDDVDKLSDDALLRPWIELEWLAAVLKNLAYHFKRIGLEAGPLSQWQPPLGPDAVAVAYDQHSDHELGTKP
jgi:hypothetical protein